MLVLAAAVLPAQQSPLEQLRRIVRDPALPRANHYQLVDQLEPEQRLAVASELAVTIDDAAAPTASRTLALRLLGIVLAKAPLPEHAADARERIARAVAHTLSDPEPSLRLAAIAVLPRLQGRPERLDWLLEGQLCLRNHLRGRAEAVGGVVDVTLLYARSLGGDAAVMLPELEELVCTDGEERIETEARSALVAIGRAGTREVAVRVFAALGRELAAVSKPGSQDLPALSHWYRRGDRVAAAMRWLLEVHTDLLREPPAAEAFLQLLPRFVPDPKQAMMQTAMEQSVLLMLMRHAAAMREIADADVRQRALTRLVEAMRPFATHANEMLRQAALALSRL